jgi:hypothetical protein
MRICLFLALLVLAFTYAGVLNTDESAVLLFSALFPVALLIVFTDPELRKKK